MCTVHIISNIINYYINLIHVRLLMSMKQPAEPRRCRAAPLTAVCSVFQQSRPSVCPRPPPAVSTSHKSVLTAAGHSLVTIPWSDTSKTSTSSRTRCTCASSATGGTGPRTRWPRTRACSTAAPAACWSGCWRRRRCTRRWRPPRTTCSTWAPTTARSCRPAFNDLRPWLRPVPEVPVPNTLGRLAKSICNTARRRAYDSDSSKCAI